MSPPVSPLLSQLALRIQDSSLLGPGGGGGEGPGLQVCAAAWRQALPVLTPSAHRSPDSAKLLALLPVMAALMFSLFTRNWPNLATFSRLEPRAGGLMDLAGHPPHARERPVLIGFPLPLDELLQGGCPLLTECVTTLPCSQEQGLLPHPLPGKI